MTDPYDVIVLGVGGIGSATLHQLARRGVRALGIERFGIAHDRGSSHGETRIIRKAYFEHPDYVPLLASAYALWHEHEAAQDEQLYYPVGVLSTGAADSEVVTGVAQAAAIHDIPIEFLGHDERSHRYPWFAIPEAFTAILEPDAGFLMVERSVSSFANAAQRLGAEICEHTIVTDWRATDDGVEVRTENATYRAGALVITAGAWANDFVADALIAKGAALSVLRKHLHWFANSPSRPRFEMDAGAPGFFFELDEGLFYGFPEIDTLGMKVANHAGGEVLTDPTSKSNAQDPDDSACIERFVTTHLPTVTSRRTHHVTCMYTTSPDGHFILDRHPEHDNVVFTTGLSGHGYKFAPVLGQIMADLATEGRTEHPIDFLSMARFA